MNQNNYSDLKDLVVGMTKGEISTAKRFLVAFDSNVTKNKNKGAALFKLLLAKPLLSIEKAKKAISDDVDDRSFDRQVTRLKEKLLESMLLDINIQKKGEYSDWYTARMDIRKKYMQAFAIVSRGLHKEADRLMQKVIERAEEYELYQELVEAYYYISQEAGIRHGAKAFEKLAAVVPKYERARDAVFKAEDYYYRHYIYSVEYSGQKNSNVGSLTQYISELQAAFQETNSANVGYFLYLLLMEYYLAMDDFESTLKTGLTLVTLIEESPAIYMPRRLATVYGDISDVEIHMYDFESCISHSQIAQKLFGKYEYAIQTNLTQEFHGWYYSKNINKAKACIDKLLSFSDPDESAFRVDKINYLKACTLFHEGEFRASYMLLQDVREIEEDKEGWNIGVRLLMTMNLVELELFDIADNQIEALRKHIERWKSRDDVQVRKRDELILRVLVHLEKSSFDFSEVLVKQEDAIADLSKNEKGLRWEVKTPELIVFQDWLAAKAAGEVYKFELPASAVEERDSEKEPAPVIMAKALVAN
jgi:hypothetical protein